MAEYIEREVLDDFKDDLMSRFIVLCFGNDYNKLTLITIGNQIDKLYEKHSTRPAADVVEVRHGEWVLEHETYGQMMCSVCGKECPTERKPDPYEECRMTNFYIKSNYCPNCGAKMDGKGEE